MVGECCSLRGLKTTLAVTRLHTLFKLQVFWEVRCVGGASSRWFSPDRSRFKSWKSRRWSSVWAKQLRQGWQSTSQCFTSKRWQGKSHGKGHLQSAFGIEDFTRIMPFYIFLLSHAGCFKSDFHQGNCHMKHESGSFPCPVHQWELVTVHVLEAL